MTTTGPVSPRKRWIFHFTHVDNLPAIAERGRLLCDAAVQRGLLRTEVGDPEIKDARRRRVIPIGPGQRVGDYVPFYFAPRSPMMYRISCDHRDGVPGRYPDGDRPLVYLATTIGAVIDENLTWVATDGNAATATTEFSTDLGRLDDMIDWPLMTAVRWNNVPEDLDRQRRRMAEFLVYREAPLTAIKAVCAFDDKYASAASASLTATSLASRVFVRPAWYYGYERR